MSKMRMPEMSVVRFEESDVICASVGALVKVNNFGDGTRWNGTITRGKEEVFSNVHSEGGSSALVITGFAPDSDGGYTFIYNEGSNPWTQSSLSQLVGFDDSTSENNNVDGVYVYNGNGVFEHQYQ